MSESHVERATVALPGGPEGGLVAVLRRLLASGAVEGVLLPLRLPSNDGTALGLVADPALLEGAEPFSPVLPVQGGRILGTVAREGDGLPLLAVLKPCEWRAAVELAKFHQLDLERAYVIVVDCPGTVEVPDMTRLAAAGTSVGAVVEDLWQRAGGGGGTIGVDLRPACSLCDRMTADGDASLQRFGGSQVLEIGPRFAALLAGAGVTLSPTSPVGERAATVERLTAERRLRQEETFRVLGERVKGADRFLAAFSACIRCRNCMEVCPICYCPECLFRSRTLEQEPEQVVRLARRKQALRLPGDTLLFHVIRMAHMATSCVGCGLCESACPSRLPVSSLFRMVGGDVQRLFDYDPGRDPAEAPPPSTFRENELEEAH